VTYQIVRAGFNDVRQMINSNQRALGLNLFKSKNDCSLLKKM